MAVVSSLTPETFATNLRIAIDHAATFSVMADGDRRQSASSIEDSRLEAKAGTEVVDTNPKARHAHKNEEERTRSADVARSNRSTADDSRNAQSPVQ